MAVNMNGKKTPLNEFFFCGFSSHSGNFHSWRLHYYLGRAASFDLQSAFISIVRATFRQRSFNYKYLLYLYEKPPYNHILKQNGQRWRNGLERSPRQWKVGCSNPSRCGTRKNPLCSIAISAEHRSKFAALHR